MEPGSGYLVMASHLPLKRISATVRFFRGVAAVRKQLAAADGLIGYTLRAKPLARDYRTLSVWQDDTALRQFMRTPPHVQLMTSLKPVMDPRSSLPGRPPQPVAARVWQLPLNTWPQDSACSGPIQAGNPASSGRCRRAMGR